MYTIPAHTISTHTAHMEIESLVFVYMEFILVEVWEDFSFFVFYYVILPIVVDIPTLVFPQLLQFGPCAVLVGERGDYNTISVI